MTDDEPEPPAYCPTCGRPMVGVTSTGPHDHYAQPCGCRVSQLEANSF
ncbi:hypothetical protein [Salinadaptatus halalkaliphilus]|nr:hypothetical protein [Salinadaptatus halalkaliphilus]